MAITLANGSTISIASSYDAAKTITAITNADPGVATLAAHGYNDGDYLDIVSGWVDLSDRIIRVANKTTDDFEVEGIDTTSTTRFPTGGGAGSTVRKITGWTQLTQVMGSSSSGGEQQFWTGQFLEGDREVRIPTTKSASGLEFQIADDPTQPGYQLCKTANDDRLPRAVMVTLANGQKLLYKAYISLSLIPSLNVNEPMTNQVTLSLLGLPTRYAA